MAIGTPVYLGAAGGPGSGAYGPFTPTTGSQLIVVGYARNSASFPSLSIGDTAGLTYSDVTGEINGPASNAYLTITVWTADPGGSPSSNTITVSSAGNSTGIAVFEVPAGATLDLSNYGSGIDTAGDPSATIPSGSPAAAFAFAVAQGGNSITQSSGYTSLVNTSVYSGQFRIGAAYDLSSPATTVDYTSGNVNSIAFVAELAESGGGGTDALLADDIQSSSEVTSPAVGQTHAITADDVQSATEVTAPAIGQVHAITADDVESATEVTAPSLNEANVLLAEDVESTSELTAPAIGQIHALTADDTESASELTSPAVGQIHALSADDVESATEVTSPAAADIGADTDVLLAEDVESASSVTSPALVEVATQRQRGDGVGASSTRKQPTRYEVNKAVELIDGRWRPVEEGKRPQKRTVLRKVRKIARKAAENAAPGILADTAQEAIRQAEPLLLPVLGAGDAPTSAQILAAVREYMDRVAAIAWEMQQNEEDELLLLAA